jgi:hypothetical protein
MLQVNCFIVCGKTLDEHYDGPGIGESPSFVNKNRSPQIFEAPLCRADRLLQLTGGEIRSTALVVFQRVRGEQCALCRTKHMLSPALLHQRCRSNTAAKSDLIGSFHSCVSLKSNTALFL